MQFITNPSCDKKLHQSQTFKVDNEYSTKICFKNKAIIQHSARHEQKIVDSFFIDSLIFV